MQMSGRALQVESAAWRNTTFENRFAENLAKSRQMYARKQVCGNKFATDLLPRFLVTEQTKADRSIGNRQKVLQNSDESAKANRTAAKKLFENKTLIIRQKTAHY